MADLIIYFVLCLELEDGSSVKIPDTITRAKGDLCELDKLTSRDACGKKLDELHSLGR